MITFLPTLAALLAVIGGAKASPLGPAAAQVNSNVDYGTFQNPSKYVRPRFRYWVPDASVDHSALASDIAAVKAAGGGGVEVLGYYLYGGDGGQGNYTPSDWATYGWGTPAWQSAFKTLLQAHIDNSLIMDFAMGPNQGQGVPAPADSDGLMWDLLPFNATVPIGGTFDSTIPGWGKGTLQAVVAGTAKSSVNITASNAVGTFGSAQIQYGAPNVAPSLPGDLPASRIQITLAEDSLVDVTSQVDSSGHLKYTFPAKNGTENYLFAFYLVHSEYRAQAPPQDVGGPQSTPQSFIQNGSFAVDHFSALGASTMTDFWEKYVLTNGVGDLLKQIGNYAWEDSVEIRSNLYWTRGYEKIFSAAHGYDITKYLPILFHQNRLGFDSFQPSVWWITDAADSGNAQIADYRTSLGDLYGVYLQTLTNWAEKYLGLEFSAQISYNLPMDMLQNVPNVDAPECESLGFSNLVDGYRQYSGPANLAGKRVISTEIGAFPIDAFQLTWSQLTWSVKRSIAGGVNNFIFHGFPYSGPYGNTTWPVFTTFTYIFAEMHGPAQPGWDFYSDAMTFSGRLSYIFQSGIPKVDLLFYSKVTTYPQAPPPVYQPTDLQSAGYTYEYLTPENFALPEAYVANGRLAPTRQNFKAMIIRSNNTMTVDGVRKIAEFAHAGLPIIFAGGIPTYLATANRGVPSDLVASTLNSLKSLSNVHVVDTQYLAPTIAALNISPATKVSSNGTWYTFWRRDDIKGMTYVFVYNDAQNLPFGSGYSEGSIQFASTGTPYHYNAWSGEQTPILNYTQSSTSTTIAFQLAGNQSTIVAFADKPQNGWKPPTTCTGKADKGIVGFSWDASKNALIAKAAHASAPLTVSTSDNKQHSVQPASAAPFTLSNWTLTVESWSPPKDLYQINGTVKTNSTRVIPRLTSWQNIAGLQNVSGRGYYSTSFTWPPANSSYSTGLPTSTPYGAIIDFGAILHTLRVSINGHQIPTLDLAWEKADITSYLKKGDNTVEAVVSTPLGNVLGTVWDSLRTSGTAPTIPSISGLAPHGADYGLLFDVVVTPYVATVLE